MSNQPKQTLTEQPTATFPQLLTQKEVARLLRKKISWLERKRREGGGPPFRYMGRTPVYDKADVLAWIASQPLARHTSDDVLY